MKSSGQEASRREGRKGREAANAKSSRDGTYNRAQAYRIVVVQLLTAIIIDFDPPSKAVVRAMLKSSPPNVLSNAVIIFT